LGLLWARTRRRHVSGAGVAYFVWLLVPAASLAVRLPERRAVADQWVSVTLNHHLPRATTLAVTVTTGSLARDFLYIWIIGACPLLIALAWQQLRFVRGLPVAREEDGIVYAPVGATGPLVVGLVRPRIVLPLDFKNRYTALVPSISSGRRTGGKALVLLAVAVISYGAWASGPPQSAPVQSGDTDRAGSIPGTSTEIDRVTRGHVMIHGKGPLAISPGAATRWIPGTPPKLQWDGDHIHVTLNGQPFTTTGHVVATLGNDSIDLSVDGTLEAPRPGWMRNAECVQGCDEGPASSK
jgi:hypothetical protein